MKNEYGAECYAPQIVNGKQVMGFDEVELPFYGHVSLANGTMFGVGMFMISYGPQSGRLFVGIEYKGAYTFSANSDPSYVGEKLGLSIPDAEAMADFICGQFDKHLQYQENLNEDYL